MKINKKIPPVCWHILTGKCNIPHARADYVIIIANRLLFRKELIFS
nr:MAG TPA: hypothetical protein [Caudoviricetes sp.]